MARGSAAVGNTIAYTVPLGNVFLFKSLAVFAQGSTGTMGVALVAPPSLYVWYLTLDFAKATQFLEQPWIAMNAGDQLVLGVASTAPTVEYWISGALLPYNAALA